MAKLSAHGIEVGRVSYTTYTKAYTSDKTVLKNHGDGWKLAGKVKPEFSVEYAFNQATERLKKWEREHPFGLAYKKELHNLASQSKRLRLHTVIQLMYDDCDGVWSECCDGYDSIHADLDEINELCKLYALALSENRPLVAA
jgi:hypothetical protein